MLSWLRTIPWWYGGSWSSIASDWKSGSRSRGDSWRASSGHSPASLARFRRVGRAERPRARGNPLPFPSGFFQRSVRYADTPAEAERGPPMDIGEQRRTVYIEPIEEPVDVPEPSEPVPDPRKDLEREPV